MDALAASSETSYAELATSLNKIVSMLDHISGELNDKALPQGSASRPSPEAATALGQVGLQDIIQYNILPYTDRVMGMVERKRGKILRTLHYDQLRDREFDITDAHTKTFQWVFGAHSSFRFREWLREKSGIYWITGKAGSGKSTLMKFLTEHHVTKQILLEWSNDGEGRGLVIAKHFFWSPGTPVQKSQEGLFRALLFQILDQRPEAVEAVCAERLNARYADSFGSWNRRQLIQALENLGAIQNEAFKVCLFIDGLDEYDGDHAELVRIIQRIGSRPNIKICAASRPWLEFLDAFENSPWKLYVHDLTREDMGDFIQDKLHEDENFQRLQLNNRPAAADLVTYITQRAQGVFLWAFLGVQSLLRELRNEDEILDLQQRAQALPEDLSDYFDRMLHSIEGEYQQRASRLFLTLSLARATIPVIAFFYMDVDDQPPRDELNALLRDWPDVDQAKAEVLIAKKRQLIAQCKDLISISADPNAPVLFAERVGFLHRTVADYLQTDDINRKLISLAGSGFDPKRTLLQANLGQAKSLMHLHARAYIRPRLAQWILGCMYYAYQLEVSTGMPQHVELDELQSLIDEHFCRRWTFSHAMDVIFELPDITTFLTLACTCDLAEYIKYQIPECTSFRLDKVAPGWKMVKRVVQDDGFALREMDHGDTWRIGEMISALSTTASSSTIQSPQAGEDSALPATVSKTVSFEPEEPKAKEARPGTYTKRIWNRFKKGSMGR